MPLCHCERSEAIHLAAQRKNGLLRRYAPRNDGVTLSVIASAAKQSMPLQKEKMDCFVAARLAMTVPISVIASQRARSTSYRRAL